MDNENANTHRYLWIERRSCRPLRFALLLHASLRPDTPPRWFKVQIGVRTGVSDDSFGADLDVINIGNMV